MEDFYNIQNIEKIKAEITTALEGFIINEYEENSDEMVNVFFLGKYEGKEVLYDALIYTLRLHHNSELYEIAEHKAAQRFPNYKKIQYEEDENGDLAALDSLEEEIGLFMAEVMMELEDEGAIKVKEHVEIDPNLDNRIGLDVGLNEDEITHQVIKQFIHDFNNDELDLDPTLYSFQTEEEEYEG